MHPSITLLIPVLVECVMWITAVWATASEQINTSCWVRPEQIMVLLLFTHYKCFP